MSSISINQLISHIFYGVVNFVSLLGGLAVFYRCCRLSGSLNLGLKLVLILTCFDFSSSFIKCVESILGGTAVSCQIVLLARIFCERASLVWAFAMSLISFIIMRRFKARLVSEFKQRLDRVVIKVIVATLLASFFMTALYPFNVFGAYYNLDSKTQHCSENDITKIDSSKKIIYFLMERGIVYLCAILITIIAYCKSRALARKESDLIVMATKSEGSKLLIYPFAQLIIYTPMLVFSALNLFPSETFGDLEWLRVLSSVCYLSGFITFMIYKKQTAPLRKLTIEPNQISMQQQQPNESCEISYSEGGYYE